MKSYPLLLAACLVVGLAGCEKINDLVFPKTGDRAAGVEGKSTANATQTSTQEREQFLARAEQEAAALERKMETVKQQALQATGEARAKFENEIPVLDLEMKDLKAKLAALKTAAADKWKDFKVDFENAMDRMKGSIARANQNSTRNHY